MYGISPLGAWTGDVYLYSPDGGQKTAKELSLATWTDIKCLANGETLVGDRSRAYTYEKYNEDAGLGDICRHLTEKGWAPAGKKWRMPTSNEFGDETETRDVSMKNYSFVGATNDFKDITKDNVINDEGTYVFEMGITRITGPTTPHYNSFFPATGVRAALDGTLMSVGKSVICWSGSSGSPNLIGSYHLNSSSTLVSPASYSSSSSGRSIGFPVRCVVE